MAISEMIIELINNILESSAQGLISVALVFIYFAVLIGFAFLRVMRAEHMQDH